jgi:uncharacterized protein
MVIGVCTIELNLPGVASLKEKRGRIKSLKNRLSKQFNVSVAEVALHDAWQSASVGVAVVSTAPSHAEAVLDGVVIWIEQHRPDLDVISHSIECETWW